MQITVEKITSLRHAREAIAATMGKEFCSTATLNQIYTWMHSPIRTQVFNIFLEDIPSFVATHLARHVTITPFITSKRIDRGGDGHEDRYTPVDMRIFCNAEALINMACKRLCYKASTETRDVVCIMRDEIDTVDVDLANHMVPLCVFRGGLCVQPKPCGNYTIRRYDPVKLIAEMEID